MYFSDNFNTKLNLAIHQYQSICSVLTNNTHSMRAVYNHWIQLDYWTHSRVESSALYYHFMTYWCYYMRCYINIIATQHATYKFINLNT